MRFVLLSLALMVMAIVLVVLLLSAPARMSWRKVRTSFKGFSASRELAIITIRNEGPVPVKLRETFRLEYLGVPPYRPVAGMPNLVRLVPTQTNLIVAPAAQADFRIPRPDFGTSWVAWLEFSPAGPWTEVGEKLIRRQDAISKKLPMKVGGILVRGVPIYVVSQRFNDAN